MGQVPSAPPDSAEKGAESVSTVQHSSSHLFFEPNFSLSREAADECQLMSFFTDVSVHLCYFVDALLSFANQMFTLFCFNSASR